ncbi:MAG: GntR family transcriptional regulator [Thermoanaerobaculia bacterium]
MLIALDEQDSRPIYSQIALRIKEQIARGLLSVGTELPSVRVLAASLDINFHTVHRAYQKLREEGVISLRLGRRATVTAPPARAASDEKIEARLTRGLDELITEAAHLGLSPTDFRALVDRLLQSRQRLLERK